MINQWSLTEGKNVQMKNSESLKAIVVEDERYPRLSLLQKLEEFRSQIEVIDACDSYDAALKSILLHRPDLLFMDIQLQGRDSIQLLNELQTSMHTLPRVIFTTAYADRRYLMSAIKFSAVDYLLKPVDKNELALAIAKAVNGLPAQKDHQIDKLSFRTVNGKIFVNQNDIAYFLADGNYSQIIMFQDSDVLMESLRMLEQRLDPNFFLRIDRKTIINLKRIYKINSRRRQCTFKAKDGTELILDISKNGTETLLNHI